MIQGGMVWKLLFAGIVPLLVLLGFDQPYKKEEMRVKIPEASAPAVAAPVVSPPQYTSPKDIRAVYATAKTVSVPSRVDALIRLINATELNALVINVKDGDGVYAADENIKRVVQKLLKNGIYPIARIVVFQDNLLARKSPHLALKDKNGFLWTSNGGYFWVDPASVAVWDYNVQAAQSALKMGFKEVNFDYIRFPSDGDVKNIAYPVYDGTVLKTKIIGDFFAYLSSRIRADYPEAVISADLFAFSFLFDDGLGVGQRAGEAAKYFDVISPMTYPSHYSPGNFEFPNPAEHPYEVILKTLESGKKFIETASGTASVRPWLQDFDLGAVYDAKMVREEIRAVTDAGYGNSWMVWNPRNFYEKENFLPEKTD